MGCYARALCSWVVLWMWAVNGFAAPCGPWVTRVVSVQGTVEVKRAKQNGWSRVRLNDRFCAGDSIRADLYSRAGLLLRNETLLRLDQGTTLVLPQLYDEDAAWLDLLRGAVHFISNIPYQLKIKTPFVNAAIEGTEFVVRVADSDTKVWVLEGKVSVHNPQGKISLGPGEAAVAEAGKAPVPFIKIKPRDAVQWALYYPPIIDYRPASAVDANRQRAVTLYRTGQIAGAIEALNAVPQANRDSSFYSQRAALLLSVGQVQLAEPDIEKAQAMASNSGSPLALQSIIALTQNDKEKALLLAQEAAKREPESPIPQVALSYAQQAAFNIDGATDSIKKALELAPDDPLAWARLSELELSSGELDDAMDAAQKAEVLDPELSRTQMVLGFAQLMEIDIDEAQQSFNKAIELDPSAPLARLGMGLAKIRQGDVEEGRKDIEVAAVLDPENSLIRSYLGKAYYEEKRGNVANREFQMAKQLDPKDPTPWFYDAIYKQTVNRPVEALHDMQKAIELNDNRAVYRSSLLLDDDLAARSASLGRIYTDLGFEQRALLEGWKSTNIDPSNFSTHRLLSDTYSALPRRQTARVSELLQAQLLQPLNVNAIQPELAETQLAILDGAGPSNLSFNELNPLFTRNSAAFQLNGVTGSNRTWGNNAIISGIYDWFSFSLGQFHFQTDGFRKDDDIQHDIYDIFVQGEVTSNLSLQTEYRWRSSNAGKIEQSIVDPFTNLRVVTDEQLLRFGGRYQPTSSQDIVFSLIYQELDRPINFEFPIPFTPLGLRGDRRIRTHGFQGEIQHHIRSDWLNVVSGVGYVDQTRRDNTLLEQVINSRVIRTINVDLDDEPTHFNAYLYPTIKVIPDLLLTLGAGFDSVQTVDSNVNKFSPKLGVIWNPFELTTIRGAFFQGISRTFSNNQSIEPTQVAGFNQVFDDTESTEYTTSGVGIDQRILEDLSIGGEFSWREVFENVRTAQGLEKSEHNEIFGRAYMYWTPHDMVSLSAEYFYEDFDRVGVVGAGPDDPERLQTHSVPLTLRLFHPSGLFANFGTTFIHQKTIFENVPQGASIVKIENLNKFWVADLGIGYRLPKRYGIVSFEVRNLLNRKFNFQSTFNPLSEDPRPQNPRFQPERTFLGRLNLWFH